MFRWVLVILIGIVSNLILEGFEENKVPAVYSYILGVVAMILVVILL